MKTIITLADKLPESMELLKKHAAKQDALYVITDTGMIPVACVRDLSAIPCKVDYVTVNVGEVMAAVHILIGLSAKASADGIYIAGIGPDDGKVVILDGFGMPAVKTGPDCSVLEGKETAGRVPAKRTRKKKAPAVDTKKESVEEPTLNKEESDVVEPEAESTTQLSESVPENEPSKNDSKFKKLLYAYVGRSADIEGREDEIETAMEKCLSDVSLDMMLRMYVQPEIPGLYEVLNQHYKELKAALE